MNVKDEVSNILGSILKDLIGIDDTILDVMGIGVGHNDHSGSTFDLIKFKEVALFFSKFHILAEKANVVFGEVSVFVIELFLDKLFFEFACADPGEKLQPELPAVEDLILEGHLNLLHLLIGRGAIVPWPRIHPIITTDK